MFHRLCWIGWIGGAILIALSRWDLVSPEVGWAGFYLACATAVVSYLPRQARPKEVETWIILTRAMLDAKDHGSTFYETPYLDRLMKKLDELRLAERTVRRMSDHVKPVSFRAAAGNRC